MSITYDLAQRKYRSTLFPGSGWDSLGEAQTAERGPGNTAARYDATSQSYAPAPVAHSVQEQSPSGQVFTAPATVQTDILPAEQAPSLAALRTAGSASSSSRSVAGAAGGSTTYPTTAAPFDPLAALPDVMATINRTTGAAPSRGMDPGESAARAAAFARAKDQIASIGRASLNTLRNMYAGRGMNVAGGDNPLLAHEEANVGQHAAGQLGDVTREQLIQDLNRAHEIGDLNTSTAANYQGQKIGLAESILSMLQARSRAY